MLKGLQGIFNNLVFILPKKNKSAGSKISVTTRAISKLLDVSESKMNFPEPIFFISIFGLFMFTNQCVKVDVFFRKLQISGSKDLSDYSCDFKVFGCF